MSLTTLDAHYLAEPKCPDAAGRSISFWLARELNNWRAASAQPVNKDICVCPATAYRHAPVRRKFPFEQSGSYPQCIQVVIYWQPWDV